MAGNKPTENLIRCGTSSSGEAGQHFLGNWDYNALIVSRVQFAQMQEPTQNAPLGGYVQRLEQPIVKLFHSRGEKLNKEAVDAGI